MYNHKIIDKKWQTIWEKTNAFKTTDKSEKKYYALDMFPYPSGSGLHVGHPEGYLATDIVARTKRLQGFDVLHPIGWDAFGLPAEQYAMKTGNKPQSFTLKNIDNFRRQIKSLGFSYDYKKEVNTTDPQYYKWTQWIFSQMYKNNLAEIKETEVNWCQELGTVLANEEILIDQAGNKVSERGNFPVIKKNMKQWVLKITNYADKLLEGLNEVDWPTSLISLQRNWIGKKVENGKTTLHLRDWIFARQRYWGEPFPIYFDKNDVYLIEDLPVLLPDMDKIKPSGNGESPLANNLEWVNYKKDGKIYRRDTNTMPQWAGSSWYYLAYILKNDDGTYLDLNSPKAYKRFEKWMPVDLYIGGQEHAVLHLLYARFWHKVLYDLKIVPHSEPFYKVVNQGMILGPDGLKMSKSKGNVINPTHIIEKYGADTLRVYEMFMGPLTETKPWSNEGIEGIYKWLSRVGRIFTNIINQESDIRIITSDNEMTSHTHLLIKEVGEYIEQLKFNLVISKFMVYINNLYKAKNVKKSELKAFLILLSTIAPHIAEELLSHLNEKQIMNQVWPIFDQTKIIKLETFIVIQVLGKIRAKMVVTETENKEKIIIRAKKMMNVKKYLVNKNIVKIVYIKNKILNFVVK